jgi:hypothetical protein
VFPVKRDSRSNVKLLNRYSETGKIVYTLINKCYLWIFPVLLTHIFLSALLLWHFLSTLLLRRCKFLIQNRNRTGGFWTCW